MTLSEWMSRNGWTDERLAAELGLSQSSINRYRNGERRPSFEVMRKILDYTNGKVRPDDFVLTDAA